LVAELLLSTGVLNVPVTLSGRKPSDSDTGLFVLPTIEIVSVPLWPWARVRLPGEMTMFHAPPRPSGVNPALLSPPHAPRTPYRRATARLAICPRARGMSDFRLRCRRPTPLLDTFQVPRFDQRPHT